MDCLGGTCTPEVREGKRGLVVQEGSMGPAALYK